VKNNATKAITTVMMKRNFIFNKTHVRTPITAIILNHAALHDDKTIATQSIAKLIMIKILFCGFMLGININAAFKTR
jgi:hypothetical protein